MIFFQFNILLCFVLFFSALNAQSVNQMYVHDPVMIKHKDKYYLFYTGNGISVASSNDMKNWNREKRVFEHPPKWAVDKVPTFKGHIWAPDISFFNGKYYLYYSISAFGKNTSCIGVATNETLDSTDPNFKWVDHGMVIQSFPGKTNWNAIDPNIILDKKGTPYMSFGSFWGGLMLLELSRDGLQLAKNTKFVNIASRLNTSLQSLNNKHTAGDNAIEAPFVYKHRDYYYLFASIDYCCKGVNSTYKMIVGRSKNLKGPFVDDKGLNLAKAGGKILLTGNKNWHGVGHNAVVENDGDDYVVFHGYDANDNGKAKLLIRKITWNREGWPEIEL
ncbi:family 43 glycosylhydrolase [Sphingobacterium bovistauri]|uniref:Family 43 glycosylhydrolase n=1 Tax=Sphingobacterium bovistauri TaxID=2781959 RepID=A0ABS7Z0F4_9SPHI|nr:family 43 glycosylhydrolase [Sphingobacterium bovistauri]MCA5003652.1 family 43 glycosylhydrolase [Sphingobacterium bovistauri]